MGANFVVVCFDRIAKGKPLYRMLLTIIAPIFFFGIVAGLIYGALRVDGWLGFAEVFPEPWGSRLSRPFMLGGVVLMAWSASCFFRAKGTPVPFNPPRQLVTTGPYGWSRNPMMTGLFSVLVGIGVRLQSFSLLFGFMPLFIALISIQLRKVEEPGLEKRFGAAYLVYKSRIPRFVPRINFKGRSR